MDACVNDACPREGVGGVPPGRFNATKPRSAVVHTIAGWGFVMSRRQREDEMDRTNLMWTMIAVIAFTVTWFLILGMLP